MIFIGIDPGLGGAMTVLTDAGKVGSFPLATSYLQQWHTLVMWREQYKPVRAGVEYINPAIFGAGKSSSAKLYGSYQACQALLVAAGIPFEVVKPGDWQAHHNMKKNKGEPQTHWKARLARKARELFPRERVTKATADAMLIALYLKDTYGG